MRSEDRTLEQLRADVEEEFRDVLALMAELPEDRLEALTAKFRRDLMRMMSTDEEMTPGIFEEVMPDDMRALFFGEEE